MINAGSWDRTDRGIPNMKRMLSLLLTLVLLATSFPLTVFAEEQATPVETAQQEAQVTEAPQETKAAEETQAPETVQTETPQESEQPPAEQETAPAEATETPAPEATDVPPTPEDTQAPVPALVADTASLAFDALSVGYETAQALTFTLTNTGNAAASLRYGDTASFTVAGAAELAAGAATTVTVTPIAGLSVGTYSEVLAVTADGCEASVALNIEIKQAAVQASMALISRATLPAPATFTATSAGYNSVLLSWTEVDGADGYVLYQSALPGSQGLEVGRVLAGTTEFTVRSLTCGTTYYFKVQAYQGEDYGAISAPKGATPLPVAPTGLTATVKSMQSIRVEWNKNTSGTSGYMIYYSVDGTSFTRLTTITSRYTVYFDHTNLVPGTTYYYRISAYYTVSGVNIEGIKTKEADMVQATPELPAVTTFTATALTASSLRLKWTRQASVSGYRIYRRMKPNETPRATFDIPLNTTISMDDTGLLVGTTYYYTIEPYFYVNALPVYGTATEASGVPLPTAPTTIAAVSSGYDQIKVSWGSVADADGYNIYRRDAADTDPSFKLITSTSSVSYVDDDLTVGLVTGKAYQYYVKSYCMNMGTPVESTTASKTAVARPKPEKVSNLAVARDTSTSLMLTWDVSSGADGYIVEMNPINTFPGSSTTAMVTTNPELLVEGLTCGRRYYFRIISTVTVDGETTRGTVSDVLGGRPTPMLPEGFRAEYTSSSYNVVLRWDNASAGASGYYIKRSTTENTGYSTVGTVTSALRLYYVDSGLITGQTYYYKICPYVTYSGTKYSGMDSDYVMIKASPGKPTISSVVSAGTTSLKVTWGAVAGATGYTLYYANVADTVPENCDAITITSGTQTTATLTDKVKAGETTYVKLQAYTVLNGVQEVGEVSAEVAGIAKPGKVPGLTVTPANAATMKLSWTALTATGNKADGYYVYRCAKDGSGGVQIADVDEGSTYTVTGLEEGGSGLEIGKYYYYYVAAYAVGTDTTWVIGTSSDVKGALITPTAPTGLAVAVDTYASLMITWDEATDANGYELYYSTDNANYRLLKRISTEDVNPTEYTHLKLTPGRRYYYKVRTYFNPTPTSYLYSAYCAAVSQIPRPLAPEDVAITVDAATGNPKLTWTKAIGAAGYLVFYDTDPDGAFSSYRTISSNTSSATISGLTVGKTYYFKVKSRVVYANATVASEEYSAMVSDTVVPARPKTISTSSVNYNTVKVYWSAVTGALGYYVNVYSSPTDATPVTSFKVEGATTRTITSNLISGQTMYYAVAAYCKDQLTDLEIVGIDSARSKRLVRMPAPTTVAAKTVGSDRVSITWTTVSGAEGYSVRRKLPGEAAYTEIVLLHDASARQYIDTLADDIAVGSKIYYTVSAWLGGEDVNVYGAPSAVMTIYRLPGTPDNLFAVASNYNTVELNWDEVDGITSYQIQYSTTSSTSGFTTISPPEKTSTKYIHKSLLTNRKYYYRVRTYQTVGSVRYYSPFSSAVSATPLLEKAVFTAESPAARTVLLTWETVAGASGYYIDRRLTTDTGYTRITQITKSTTLAFTNTKLVSGASYYFRITPYRYVNGATISGPNTYALVEVQ